MDEEEALRLIDDELDAALGGVTAPGCFAAAVRARVREQRISPLPELLDSIGWAAVMAIVFELLLWCAPMVPNYWGMFSHG